MRLRPGRTIAIAAIAVIGVTACSGTSSTKLIPPSVSLTTAASPTTISTATTVAATTTTAEATTTSTTQATTTTTGVPVAPLTGLPQADATKLSRPALIVKIGNTNAEHPQVGINQADVVFEEIVEGATRLATVFQSTDADPVGGIRSARTSDINIAALLNKPLFAWSGGNPGVIAAVGRANGSLLVDAGNYAISSAFFRVSFRHAPYNLFSTTPILYQRAPAGAGTPHPLFPFRNPAVTANAAGARPVSRYVLSFGFGYTAEYTWDASHGAFLRAQSGKPHVDEKGVQVAPANVVVLFVTYRASPADPRSPEAQTVGSGRAQVLTNGQLIDATWARATPSDSVTLLDSSAQPILLTPGRTWVELATPTTPVAVS